MSESGPQKIIVSLVLLAFFALIVLPGLDYRTAWSLVAPWVSILGDVVILLSFLFIFWVTLVNSFAASNIRVEKDQEVIRNKHWAVRARASSDVHRRHLAFHRNAARARFVVARA